MNRRSFMGLFGAAGVVAPAVKSAVTLPDVDAEKFERPPVDVGAVLDPRRRGYGLDWRDGLLYDRIRFEPGARLPCHIRFFQQPVGQPCYYTGKYRTQRNTNIRTAGQLPMPEEFLAARVLFAVHPSTAPADLDAVSWECTWDFQLLQKHILGGPLALNTPAPAGLRDIVRPDGAAVDPLPAAVLASAHYNTQARGVFIPPQHYFCLTVASSDNQVTLLPASEGGRGLDLLVALQGAHGFSVQ